MACGDGKLLFNFNDNGGDMNALEMALEALTNPSTIAVSHAINLIRDELAKPKRQWVGLTDDEKESVYKHADAENHQLSKVVSAVEWLLKNKNTT